MKITHTPFQGFGSFSNLLKQIALGVSLFISPLLYAANTVAEWQEKALQAYPALGQADSDFNRAFVQLYHEKKANDPDFFKQTNWPWVLATQVAQNSGITVATTETAPTPTPIEENHLPAATPTPTTTEDQSSEWEADKYSDELGLEFAKFRWWCPGGIKPRGVFILAPGRGGDGRGMAKDAKWQALARKHHLAIIACFLKNRADRPFDYQRDPNGETTDLVDRAVDTLMAENGYSQKNIPLFFYGHSAGGNISQNYANRNANRMLGAVLMRCPNGSGSYSPDKGKVPMLIYVGGKDRAEWVESSARNYKIGLEKRALWTLAQHPNEGHGIGNTWTLTEAFVNGVLEQRLGKPSSSPSSSPKKLSRQQGWLGDPETLEVTPANQFKGKKQQATWLPDETTAHLWQNYLRQ